MKRLALLITMLMLPFAAMAQYVRSDFSLSNAQGQAISGAQVYILTQPANTSALTPLASLFGSSTGTGTANCGGSAGSIANPLTTDGFGHACAYAAPGVYTIVYVSQYTGTLIYPDQQFQNPNSCTIAGCLPISGGTLTGPLIGTTITAQNTNGILNEELFTGSSVALRVNAAEGVCTAVYNATCVIQIPTYAPSGLGWNVPTNNITIEDFRFANGSGLVANQLPVQFGNTYIEYHAGANDPYEATTDSGKSVLAISAFADGGTNNSNNQANLLGIFASNIRSASSARSVWGINPNVGFYNNTASVAAGATATGMEIDLNNFGPLDDTGLLSRGILINTGDGFKTGIGILFTAGGPTGSGFEIGEAINNYHSTGIQMQSGDTARNQDISFIPPADDSGIEIAGYNHAVTTQTWSVNDLGQAAFQRITAESAFSVAGSVVAGAGLQHLHGAVGCTTTATAGATCTSSAQAWGVPFVDTNYTLTCSLDTATGVPVVTSEAKSTTSFTVTIAAVTAVAATANFDCIAMHP